MERSSKRIFIVAGEASGDLHGAALIRKLKEKDPSLKIFGMGGDAMEKEGMHLLAHSKDMAVTGVFEVFLKLFQILSVYFRLVQFIKTQNPDLIILIDYPDFNLRLAKKVHGLGIPIVYYISPQVWAWRKRRVYKIKKYITKMLVVFPFEKEFYERHGVDVTFVGHPLLDQLASASEDLCVEEASRRSDWLGREAQSDREGQAATHRWSGSTAGSETHKSSDAEAKAVIALLPGSRRNELKYLLSPMLDACEIIQKQIPNVRFTLPVAPTLTMEDFKTEIKLRDLKIELSQGNMSEVVSRSDVVMTCSGTATLETAILGKPMVILYRLNWLSYFLGKLIIRKLKYFGMPNILLKEAVVPELLQKAVTGKNIAEKIIEYLSNPELKTKTIEKLKDIRQKLGAQNVNERVANEMMTVLDQSIVPKKNSTYPKIVNVLYLIMKPLLFVFSKMYLGIVILRNAFYDRGWFSSQKVKAHVISIGNITVGGTGKTPLTIALCKALQAEGKKVGIVSRGYKRKSSNPWDCVTDGTSILLNAASSGDEPWLMATKLSGVPIYVGANRYRVAQEVLKRHSLDILLLDDAFQHRALHRNLDILTLDATVLVKGEKLLPLGPFREPLHAIRRAQVLVFTRSNQIDPESFMQLKSHVQKIHPKAHIFEANYEAKQLSHWGTQDILPLTELKGKRIFAFAGIGNPRSFQRVIQELDGKLVGFKTYLDHFSYRDQDMDTLFGQFQKTRADLILTTEKDAVRLPKELASALPLYTLGVDLRLSDGFNNEILSRL